MLPLSRMQKGCITSCTHTGVMGLTMILDLKLFLYDDPVIMILGGSQDLDFSGIFDVWSVPVTSLQARSEIEMAEFEFRQRPISLAQIQRSKVAIIEVVVQNVEFWDAHISLRRHNHDAVRLLCHTSGSNAAPTPFAGYVLADGPHDEHGKALAGIRFCGHSTGMGFTSWQPMQN